MLYYISYYITLLYAHLSLSHRPAPDADNGEPKAKVQRTPSCPYSEVVQGHTPEQVNSK